MKLHITHPKYADTWIITDDKLDLILKFLKDSGGLTSEHGEEDIEN